MYSVKIYGAGSIGNHLSYACRNKGWNVTVYDIDESALSRMKNDIYPSRYGKWDDEIVLTNNEQVIDNYYDVVIVGTPPETHIPIALEELESKNPPKILMVEKPLGTPDLKGCQELWDMSNEKDVLVVEDLENSDLSYDFDIMNDYDNSLSEFNGLLSTLNAIGINRIEASSSIEDFEESDIDPYVMNSFLKDTGLA